MFNLTVVDTEKDRAIGLSNNLELPYKEGMLFVFENLDKHSFWMKDMNFPIDIIWIDSDFNIVSIKENVTPKSYPNSFVPQKEALYVLEVNFGAVNENNIKIGDPVSLNY